MGEEKGGGKQRERGEEGQKEEKKRVAVPLAHEKTFTN